MRTCIVVEILRNNTGPWSVRVENEDSTVWYSAPTLNIAREIAWWALEHMDEEDEG